MNSRHFLSAALLLAALPALAGAETITNFNGVLTSSSATELGRPFRSGSQQTWTGAEPYDGKNNLTTAFAYTTYTFAASLFTGAPYVEVSVLDTLGGTSDFVTAYAGSFNVNSQGTNWLGDEGGSGNYFGLTDGRYFDVILPVGQNLVLVLNDSSVAALNDPINIEVDAYADTNYDDPVVTPEPSTFVMLGTGLVWAAGMARRRYRQSAL